VIAVDYLEVTWRTLAAMTALLVMARLSGKQQVAHLTIFEYITGITIGSTASALAINLDQPFLPILLGLVLWVGATILLNNLGLRSRRLGKVIRGEPTILIENGRIVEEALRQVPNLTLDDLLMELRKKGVFNVSQVEYAVIELDGSLSVLPKSQYRSVQPHDLKLDTSYEGLGIELVYDGRVVRKNLAGARLDEEWLRGKLAERGVTDLSQVMLAQLNTDGTLYVDLRDDQPITIDVSDYKRQLEKL